MIDSQSALGWTSVLLLASVALVWAGMVVGVSGLATPVKFTAPSLTLPVALDVGRVTFQLFNRVEWGLAFVLVALGLVTQPRLLWIAIGLVVVAVVLQAVWLLPALNARITAVIAGGTLPSSSLHAWYVVVEGVKLLGLVAIGVGAFRSGS